MGKHKRNNNTSNTEKNIRIKKKQELKKNISNFLIIKNNKIGKQSTDLPKLKNIKASMITDIKNKKNSGLKEIIINTLKNKLENEDQLKNNELVKNHKININNLIEASTNSQSITTNHNINNIKDKIDYYNREETSYFFNESIRNNKINVDYSKKTYFKDLKKVVESSDIILEVLDARDPNSYRSKELELQILSYKDQKKLILIVNKIDLVSRENAQSWKDYLKQEYPCVLFKANTQSQSNNFSNVSLYHSTLSNYNKNNNNSLDNNKIDDIINSSKTVGGEELMNIIKNYCRIDGSSNAKKTVVVGIVGYPNVGKSSIINSLKRGKAVGVSSVPGFTKSISEIILDKNIKLLDCPGVVYSNNTSSENSNSDCNLLANILRPEHIEDPVNVVRIILQKVNRDEIIKIYNLEKEINNNSFNKSLIYEIFSTSNLNINQVEKFLCVIGMKFGKFKKGGVVDLEQAARLIIIDWNNGKIKYMTPVPNNCYSNLLNNDININ